MAKENLITTAEINTTVRAIDFANTFTTTWQHLKDIMTTMRMIRKAPGTALKSKYVEGELQAGKTTEGDATPYSQYEVKETYLGDMTIEQYALVGSTVKSYLAWLRNEGKLEIRIEDSRVLWARI